MANRSLGTMLSFRCSQEFLDLVDAAVKKSWGSSASRVERGEYIRAAVRMRMAREANPPHGIPLVKKKVAKKKAV